MSPLFMLIPLGIVFLVGLVFVRLAANDARQRRENAARREASDASPFPGTGLAHGLSGRAPRKWLAVRSQSLATVQEALGLARPQRCAWSESILSTDDDRLFLSPAVSGWILVTGAGLPDPLDDPDRGFHFLVRLSQELGEVHYYALDRVVHHHAWVRAEQGCIVRAYAWAGETLWNQGRLTAAERKLAMTCHPYGQSDADRLFSPSSPEALNTERVPQLAACWSLDPTRLEETVAGDLWGISGTASPGSLG